MSEKVCAACGVAAEFELRRMHDGGGKELACSDHLAALTHDVAASLPEWASSPKSHAVYVRELS